MQADTAIVIAAYDRPVSFKRLLASIATADYAGHENIPLVISIDWSGSDACAAIAENFEWPFGEKKILVHTENLGLKKHILQCGALTETYPSIILLEDDLYVSRFFYNYAQQANRFYANDERIAGIALYQQVFNETALCPFEPIDDGYDNYFMQIPCSWGQLWTREQWNSFSDYENTLTEADDTKLPLNVKQWPSESSWKKKFYSYLVQSKKYFVYPRTGLSTNFGDAGQHLKLPQNSFQTSLLLGNKDFRFSALDESTSVYDAFFELEGKIYNKIFNTNISVSFDLNGTKPLESIETPYLISSKSCLYPEKKIPLQCYPYENNILLDITATPGNEYYFSMAKTNAFIDKPAFNRHLADLLRVFLTDGFVRTGIQKEFEKNKAYRLGKILLKPFSVIKRLFKTKV